MNKLLLTAILTTSAALTLQAETLSPDQALARARRNNPRSAAAAILPAGAPQLSSTVAMPLSGKPALYIFSGADDRGLAVISADDCVATALLGYSDAPFVPGQIPPAMEAMLSEYAREIEAAAAAPAARILAEPAEDRDPVGPLLTTQWNQDAPYNELCPLYNGQRSVTGCVATAMAQVMKYHNWPEHGKSSVTYNWGGGEISMNFLDTYFDWANMTDTYGSASTAAEREAVARLMYACGVATEMQYSPMASGTPDFYAPLGLVNYLNYDKGIRYVERSYYPLADWEVMIYDQLISYGPVIYSGSSASGGHCFVVDGYSADRYFHVNWGWGGVSDGFFRLSALDPGTQGIGGSSSAFNSDQSAILNIRKLGASRYIYESVMIPTDFAIAENNIRLGNMITISATAVNYSIQPLTGAATVKMVNEATGDVTHCVGQSVSNWPVLTGLGSWTVSLPASLDPGTYTLTPEWVNSRGQYQDIPVKLSQSGRVRMTVTNNTCTFENIAPGAITASDVTMLTPVVDGQMFRLTATLTNDGDQEYLGTIVPVLATGSTILAQADDWNANVEPHSTQQLNYEGTFSRFATAGGLEPGTYTLYLMDTTSKHQISTGLTVTYQSNDNTELSVSDFRLEGDNNNADPANLTFAGTVSCNEGGYFAGQLVVVIFPYQGGNVSSVGGFPTRTLVVDGPEGVEFTAPGAMAGNPGGRYFAVLFNGQEPVSKSGQEVIFTLAKTTGTDLADADRTAPAVTLDGTTAVATLPCSSIEVYSTSGVAVASAAETDRIDLSALPRGFYLIRLVPADRAVAPATQVVSR
ncbi:MAG: C10 family peptidase [Clostridium sp.]|nr:C10 family peptidase [Clostridium sp.]